MRARTGLRGESFSNKITVSAAMIATVHDSDNDQPASNPAPALPVPISLSAAAAFRPTEQTMLPAVSRETQPNSSCCTQLGF
jgi:hypothetical protein